MTTVFITGAPGFVGQAVMHELLKRLKPEDRLFTLARNRVEFVDRRVIEVVGDLTSLDKVGAFVRQADYLIHIAAESRLFGGHDYHGINVAATQQLVDFAKASDTLQRFIFISSIAAMDRSPSDPCTEPITVASSCCPRSEYGRSKLLAEEAILQSNLPYTIFRPGFVYGSGMRNDSHLRKFARLIRKGVPLHRFGFPGKISLVHVDDLASAIVKCLEGERGMNRTYLAETEYLSLGVALSLLGKALYGRQSVQIRVPPFKGVIQMLHSRLPAIVAGMFLDYFWMEDQSFRDEFIEPGQKKLFCDNVFDIIKALPGAGRDSK